MRSLGIPSTAGCVDLEITLRSAEQASPSGIYAAEARWFLPTHEEQPRWSGIVYLDLATLDKLRPRDLEYGRQLGQALFADPALLAIFDDAEREAGRADVLLRVRLRLLDSAQNLHRLHWEVLRDPRDQLAGRLLFVGDTIAFSRYLESQAKRWPRPRPLTAQHAPRRV